MVEDHLSNLMLPSKLQAHILTRVLMKESQEEWFHCTTLDLPEAQFVAANTMSHVMEILDNHTLHTWAVRHLSWSKHSLDVIMVSSCSFICSTEFAAHLTCNCCSCHSRAHSLYICRSV